MYNRKIPAWSDRGDEWKLYEYVADKGMNLNLYYVTDVGSTGDCRHVVFHVSKMPIMGLSRFTFACYPLIHFHVLQIYFLHPFFCC